MIDAMATIEVPRHILESARVTPEEARVELALEFYRQRRLSIGAARELAGKSLWEFRQLAASRQIAPHYGVDDLGEDLQTWQALDAS